MLHSTCHITVAFDHATLSKFVVLIPYLIKLTQIGWAIMPTNACDYLPCHSLYLWGQDSIKATRDVGRLTNPMTPSLTLGSSKVSSTFVLCQLHAIHQGFHTLVQIAIKAPVQSLPTRIMYQVVLLLVLYWQQVYKSTTCRDDDISHRGKEPMASV